MRALLLSYYQFVTILIGLFTLIANSARAGLVWENSGVTPNNAYFSDIDWSPQFVADDFLLANTARLDSVQWTGIYGNGVRLDDFVIEIMIDSDSSANVYQMQTVNDISGVPVSRTNTGLQLFNRTLFSYTADLSSLNVDLSGGQQYFITIYNDTADGRWSIAADDTSGRALFDNNGRDSISTFGASLDFRLFGVAVPEPNTGLLFLSCIPMITTPRRRI